MEQADTVRCQLVACYILQKLTVGTLLLCAVREVKDYTLLVSLPFNIPATVHITDISIPFKNLAHQLAESVDNEVNVFLAQHYNEVPIYNSV